MKRVLSTLLFATVAFSASHANAWMAVAVGDNAGSFVSFNNDTPEEARTSAMQGCSKMTANCEIKAEHVKDTALVIAKGIGGWGEASNADPAVAMSQAMNECKKSAKSCSIKYAAWDNGSTFAAVAMSNSGLNAIVDSDTQKQAEEDAIAECQKQSNKGDQCKIDKRFSTSDHMFYAIARGKQTGAGIGASAQSIDRAKKLALEGCAEQIKPGDACAVSATGENRGPKPAPASMQRVLAIAEKNQTTPVATTTSRTVVHCTNQCMNGDCIRTFDNGRKERWQAPRVFDPFSQNWKYDTDTNACGV